MIAFNTNPAPFLKEYISEIRIRHFLSDKEDIISFKPYPPKPEQCITFYPKGFEIYQQAATGEKKMAAPAVITGQFTERINRYVSKEFLMITVVLAPGFLHRLTGIPASEFCNKHIPLESIFPRETQQVCVELSNCSSYQEMILLIEHFFCCLLKKIKTTSHPGDQLFQVITNQPGNYSLDWLSQQAYLSPRQLERKFYQHIGVCPKTFLRIIRFYNSYHMRLNNLNEDWLSIAIACGYHDYQHMVRDYKEFVNTGPNQFFLLEENAPGRKLGLTLPYHFKWLRKK